MLRYFYSDRVYRGASATSPEALLIGIADQYIVSVEALDRPTFQSKNFSADVEVVDIGDQLITPAFINAHTHLSMSVFRGVHTQAFGGNIVEDLYYRLESLLTAADIRAFARFAAYEAMLSGTGLVWDHYYHGESLAAGLAEAGLPAVIAPTLQDLHGPGVSSLDKQLSATETLDSEDWRKKGIFSAVGPHATDTVSDGLWTTVRDLAERRQLPIHVHVSQSPEEYARLMARDGRSPIQFLVSQGVVETDVPKLFVHGLYATADDLRALKGHDVVLGYCPFSQIQFGFPAQVGNWSEHGLRVAIGTDCGASNDSMDVQQELRLAAGGQGFGITSSNTVREFYRSGKTSDAHSIEALRLQQRATKPTALKDPNLLDTVWATPGMLHPKLKCGRIAVGCLANLAIWDSMHPNLWPMHDVQRSLVMNHTASALNGLVLMGQPRGKIGDFQRSILAEDGYIESRMEAEARRDAFMKRLI